MDDSQNVYKANVEGWIRLLTYVKEVMNEIGEEKALEILSNTQIQELKKWFAENVAKRDLNEPPLLAAYRMLFEDMLGCSISEIDIVEQSEERIVHHYKLPCPILDACLKLDLDTRKICKALFHEALNELMQLVDPRLRFDRDYEKLRPYVPYCLEKFWLESQQST